MRDNSNSENKLPKLIYIETYGCQMNEYDTELVKAILEKAGYQFINDALAADIVMLNTCAIREHAHRKVYGRIHEIRYKRNELNKLNELNEHHQPNEPNELNK